MSFDTQTRCALTKKSYNKTPPSLQQSIHRPLFRHLSRSLFCLFSLLHLHFIPSLPSPPPLSFTLSISVSPSNNPLSDATLHSLSGTLSFSSTSLTSPSLFPTLPLSTVVFRFPNRSLVLCLYFQLSFIQLHLFPPLPLTLIASLFACSTSLSLSPSHPQLHL